MTTQTDTSARTLDDALDGLRFAMVATADPDGSLELELSSRRVASGERRQQEVEAREALGEERPGGPQGAPRFGLEGVAVVDDVDRRGDLVGPR